MQGVEGDEFQGRGAMALGQGFCQSLHGNFCVAAACAYADLENTKTSQNGALTMFDAK